MTDPGYSRLAAEHLPADLAQRFTALLRPCLRLHRTADGEQAVAVFGGQPRLPAGIDWPEWPGHGPLRFVASVRCAALPREGVAFEFPQDGTLLFFCYDGPVDAAETQAAARVVYVTEDAALYPADLPQGVAPYPPVHLAAHVAESAPDLWLPQVRQALLRDGGTWPPPQQTPNELRAFRRAFSRRRTGIGYQLGGHAVPVQGPVEYEIAGAALGGEYDWGEDLLDREAERWHLLAQFDSEDDGDEGGEARMTWGDGGALYWLIRADDLAARRFDRARFTLQS